MTAAISLILHDMLLHCHGRTQWGMSFVGFLNQPGNFILSGRGYNYNLWSEIAVVRQIQTTGKFDAYICHITL